MTPHPDIAGNRLGFGGRVLDAFVVPPGQEMTYAEFARAVAKFPREQLLRVISDMAAEEARTRMLDSLSVPA